MKKTLILIALFVLSSQIAFAHQPRLLDDVVEVVQIESPEVSQAFYATLSGGEDLYTLSSEEEFLLLVELITPVIKDKEPGIFNIEVVERNSGEVFLTGTTTSSGSIFFEPFVRDEYIEGPNVEQTAPAGTYDISVRGNEEKKYVLVVGKREFFPFDEILNTYKSLPFLKVIYFEKPIYTIFTNPTGGGLLFVVIMASLVIFGLIKVFRRRKKD